MKQRMCIVAYEPDRVFYFHRYIDEARTKMHPEDSRKDLVYAHTFAVLEDISNGRIELHDVDALTFINDNI
jgi:hypothetical protein